MKRSSGFATREVAGQVLLVPVGAKTQSFSGLIALNESGAVLWNALERERLQEELVAELLNTFLVDEDTARRDVLAFMQTALSAGLLERSE